MIRTEAYVYRSPPLLEAAYHRWAIQQQAFVLVALSLGRGLERSPLCAPFVHLRPGPDVTCAAFARTRDGRSLWLCSWSAPTLEALYQLVLGASIGSVPTALAVGLGWVFSPRQSLVSDPNFEAYR